MSIPLIDFDINDVSFAKAMFELRGLQKAALDAARAFDHPEHSEAASLALEFMEHYGYSHAVDTVPVLTGTLQSAHRLWPESIPDGVRVTLGIDHVQNPVFGGYADEYGPEVNQRKPWMTDTLVHIRSNLHELESHLEDWIVELF